MMRSSRSASDEFETIELTDRTEGKSETHTKAIDEPASPPVDHAIAIKLDTIDHSILVTDPRSGLTDEEVESRRALYGWNEIVEKKRSRLKKFLGYFTGSIAFLIEAAAILSAALQDWVDFGIISGLLLVNALIGYIEEERAETAVDALKSTLALRCRVMRNGRMIETESRSIVPGDIIALRTGDIVSADCIIAPNVLPGAKYRGVQFMHGRAHYLIDLDDSKKDERGVNEAELLVDQSALTGESLPVNKLVGDLLYSSSLVKSGQSLALVLHTGSRTFVGRAANLIAITVDPGHFQQVIEKIGNFLVVITVVFVAIILIVGTVALKHPFVVQLQDCLVICIASIPVGLPTVLSVTMAVGAQQLAAKQVIVKRLTAVEEMAGVDVLCSDKTGTLTKNQLQFDRPWLNNGYTANDLLLNAYLASEHATKDAIDVCLRESAVKTVPSLKGLEATSVETPGFYPLKHEPFTSTTKLATTIVRELANNRVQMIAKGAPQVILDLASNYDSRVANRAITEMAKKGLRSLGVARSSPIQGSFPLPSQLKSLQWDLIGIVSLLDPPRDDSADTIRKCREFGIQVKMITGDAILIAKEVARRLGMQRTILAPEMIQEGAKDRYGRPLSEDELIHMVTKCDGFAQVVPEDKYRVVELMQQGGHLVGMTGDGVNDAPALKRANVGIAVHGCTDAARAAADIVLLEPGLTPIADGVMTSRAIFERMRSYSLYRITSTIHFLLFLFLSILIFDFTLPAVLIVLITVMNDAATLVISVDNAEISRTPNKWRIGQLITLSFVLALLLLASSFVHFLVFYYVFAFSYGELATVMYLQISSSPHFVIFSTRVPGHWYKNKPSWKFTVAVIGTQIIATLFAVYGALSPAIGWPASIAILMISLVYFMLLDYVKIFVYRHWSERTTLWMWPSKARRASVARKIAEQERLVRIRHMVHKLRRATHALAFLHFLVGEHEQRCRSPSEVSVSPRHRARSGDTQVNTCSGDSGVGVDITITDDDDDDTSAERQYHHHRPLWHQRLHP